VACAVFGSAGRERVLFKEVQSGLLVQLSSPTTRSTWFLAPAGWCLAHAEQLLFTDDVTESNRYWLVKVKKKNHGKETSCAILLRFLYWNKVNLEIYGHFTAVENKLVSQAGVINADFVWNYWDSYLNSAFNRKKI